MNPVFLRRTAIAGLILTVLLALDGIYMIVSNYQPDDAGDHPLHMSDGTTVLIAAAILLIVTVVAFMLSRRPQTQVATAGVTPEVDTTGEALADTSTAGVTPEASAAGEQPERS
ncbi:hypothetical protein KDA_37680 [Dictyobacter alpinus]|uniref:Uncharacterized protein n=1 Tax=Dictyobacter alpinus TaxID=2014873 RepID=A0A402BA75_9CHLR|nr:hypothetical protein [Dictyobacter alpinus]GCE28284.1 hypothetical protein KDA_37680 [Dictyobacter alpinus]